MPRTLRPWSLAALIGVAGALGLAACSSSPSNPSSATSTSSTTASTSTSPSNGEASAIAPIPAEDRSPAGTAGTEPTVTVPSGPPPTELQSADLITGTGPAAANGDNVTVQYVLATYSSGKVIQSSWGSQPFTFTLGQGQVIPGWDKGVVGMKVGGRRELIIPPSLGYGAQSPGQGIAANDTLVFVIDLQKIG
jgi:peptidylprolyl isomerase